MVNSNEFLGKVLDNMADHVVVVDRSGQILYVNRRWCEFAEDNNCGITDSWAGVNYLQVCDRAAAQGDESALQAAQGIREFMASERAHWCLEYPCHSPEQQRWFMMSVSRFELNRRQYFVITHHDITQRKLAEDKVSKMALIDSLTGIPNRRCFDTFFQQEWRRSRRLKSPLSLALIDIDYFKLLNDRYGHQTGDACLRKIGRLLKDFVRRPGDLCARYGGEEFAVVYGNTDEDEARHLLAELSEAIRQLAIPNEGSTVAPYLTVSAGLATARPGDSSDSPDKLIARADRQLYLAKDSGRNCTAVAG